MTTRPVESELSRDLTLFQIVMMGLGMMIGAGVFVGIGLSVRGAGPGGLLLTFALNGLLALLTAMSFAELSSAIPRAGGAYNFARIGFGRGASFIAGWMEWFASSLAGAFYAVVFATFTVKYLDQLMQLGLSESTENWSIKLVALVAAGFFIFINYRGSSETGKVGAIFSVAQMAFVWIIAVAGVVTVIRHPHRLDNFQPFLHPDGWPTLLGTMGVIYVAFEGFEVIAQAGDEAINPRKNIPKAMLYSVLVVTVTYVLVAFATVIAIEGEGGRVREWFTAHKDIDGFRRAVAFLLPYGSLLVTLAVIFSATSALNATIYSATRASYALGRDGMLFAMFARISPTRKTPYVALLFTGAIVLVAAASLNPEQGAAAASIMFLMLFFVVNLSVIKIRRNMGDELEYGFLMPLFPVMPILAIICQIALAGGIVRHSTAALPIAAAVVPAGVLLYFLYGRSHATVGEHEIQVLEEAPAPKLDKYRIMVAVANPDSALELVRNTYKLAGAKDAQVELLHMVPVPDQVPLSDAHEYMLEGKEGILETMLYLAPLFPISTHLRYCRNPGRGIVSAVREKRTQMLIMGWHGGPRRRAFHLGSTVDPVIELAPCNTVILKDCGGNVTYRNVLVPLAGGPNGAFALEVASILADSDEGHITAMTVDTGRSSFDLDEYVADRVEKLKLDPSRVSTKVVASGDVGRAIVDASAEFDLVVVGCTRRPILSQFARPPVPDVIAGECPKPLVMVQASGGLDSWVKRWL